MTDTPKARAIPFGLALSIIVNLVLIGALAGFVLRSGPAETHRPRPPMFEQSASRGDVQAIRGLMRAATRASIEERRALMSAQATLADVLEKEPFDDAAVRAAFEELGAADRALNAAVREALMDGLADLTPDQRKRVAKFLMQRQTMGGRKSGTRPETGAQVPGPSAARIDPFLSASQVSR